jgi:hypothetical protein
MLENSSFILQIETAENFGFLRLNWSSPGRSNCPVILLTPREADAAVDFVGALEALGYVADVWRLDRLSTRVSRNRRDEMKRLERSRRAAQGGEWVGVIPFDVDVANLATKTFPDAVLLLIADDLLVLGLGDESVSSDIRRSLLNAARSVAEMAVFVASSRRPLMMFSMRKAKEFPEVALQAFGEFRGVCLDVHSIQQGSEILGRKEPSVSVQPVNRIAALDVIRGGIEPIHKDGAITGWAKRSFSEERVGIGARIDGREIARSQADILRQDLAQRGVGDGQHGFELDVSKALTHEPVRIEVFALESGLVIGAVDMTVERGDRVLPGSSILPTGIPQVAAE